MRVTSIQVYPVKATAAVEVQSAVVERSGLRDDRRWAVIDANGSRLNGTTHDRLMGISATPLERGGISLAAVGRATELVPVPRGGGRIAVDVSRLPTMVDAGDAAAAWLTEFMGEPVRLAWQDDPQRRPMAPGHGGAEGDSLSLADAAPLLLTTTSSLDQLNDWIAEDYGREELVMDRFRPNVVIEGSRPFEEDDWRDLQIGDVPYRFAEHCDRCMVTLIDPSTLTHGKEPIRTLARHHRWNGKTWFGIRIVPLATGTLTVGDEVSVG